MYAATAQIPYIPEPYYFCSVDNKQRFNISMYMNLDHTNFQMLSNG